MSVSCVISLAASQHVSARALADKFLLPFIDGAKLESGKAREIERFVRSQVEVVSTQPTFVFLLSGAGLALAQITAENVLSIRADFYSPTIGYRRQKGGGRGQMIAKAVGLAAGKLPTVLDATAGLGGDAFVLASLGCKLTMIERVPEVRALLEDGLQVAREWGEVNDHELVCILDRMQLIEANAHSYLDELKVAEFRPDVVYLDPMFPARTKSAQVKKEMRVFHQLVGTDPDADRLLERALACARQRVVVKRPRIAPVLADSKPSFTLEGKSNRFDVYLAGQS
jgi:16S rRNA (guanine1516-N2)-methyltransferase